MPEIAAGMELDAAVAEKIMGFRFWMEKRGEYTLAVACDGGESPWDSYRYDCREQQKVRYTATDAATAVRTGFFGTGFPHYSTSIADAWTVVEKMRDMGFQWELCSCRQASGLPAFGASFAKLSDTAGRDYNEVRDEIERCFVLADTAPLAICRAVLKAVTEASA